MKNNYPIFKHVKLASVVILCLVWNGVWGQNAIIGTGFAGGWDINNEILWRFFEPSAGTSRIRITQANNTGNQFFRFVRGWGDGDFRKTQFRPNSGTDTEYLNFGSILSPLSGDNGAFFINVSNINNIYVFKTRTPNETPNCLVFQIQGNIQSVSTITRQLEPIAPAPGQAITITANLSDNFNTGQSAYLRYTTDNFTTSTIVEMSGSGTTRTASIPSNVNTAGANVRYYVFTSGNGLNIIHADADFFTINLNNNSGSNFEYTVSNSWISTTTSTSNWNDVSTWETSEVPPSNANITLRKSVNLTDSRTIGNLTIDSGGTLTFSGSETLTLNSGSTLTNNGIFTPSTGTVTFAGTATVTGTIGFNNVTLAGGVNFGSSSTINGEFRILAGGFTNGAPIYGSNSTLIFDTGGSFTVDASTNLWTTGSTLGAGVPKNVVVTSTKTLNIFQVRNVTGNLTINNGSELFQGNNDFIIQGNLLVNGTYTIASDGYKPLQLNGDLTIGSEGSVTLGGFSGSGGDLLIRGNWMNQGMFNSNNRAVFFDGTTPQTIQNEQTQGISIPFLFIQNDVTAISDMNVNNNLDITASGVLTMNSGKTLNMGSGANLINLGTLAIEGTLTDQRTTKTYGGTVRYSASSGSQIVVGGNYANLELSGNSTKSFDGNAQISGNFSVTGGDVTPPSSITFNGSSTQSLAGLAYNNIAFSNGGTKTFTSAASVSPTAAITFSGTAGTVDFDGDGSVEFVLRSDSNGTARVGNVNGFTLSGIVTAERYIPQGKRAFRFLTSPVNSTESIRVNWQNNGVASAGIGTHITGSGGSTNGFDTTASNSSSLFTYNNQVASGTGWTAVTNTNETTLIAGVPYRILIRGDRNVDLTAASAPNMNTAVTLRTKGTLTTGPVTYNASSSPVAINNTSNTTTNDYSLVGNPFMSPIDWHNVSKTNLENSYYAWDGNMGTNGQRGRYVTYSQTSETNNVIESAVNKFIQPGQAFFVKNSIVGTAGDLTISESNKAAIVNNPVFRNNENSSENEKLSVLLYEPTVLSLGGFPIDGTVAVFNDSFSSEVGLGDVEKLLVSGEHISFARNTVNLAIEATQPPQTDDELFLRLLQFVASRNYTFKITAANFNASTTAFLIDNFLNTATEIDLEEDFFHTFETTTNSASFNQDRFKIVFNSSVLSTPEFNLESLSVYPNPVTDCQFWVYCPIEHSQDLNLILYSVLGNKIDLKISPDNSGLKVQLPSHLNAGVYFLTLELGGKKSVKKLIVK